MGEDKRQDEARNDNVEQRKDAERTGRIEEVTGEARSFKPGEAGKPPIPDPNDLQGPAGDPAEGKPPGGSSYPA
jgi:hypothetical protein